MTPIISVVIPTANRPDFLPRAVDSALSGLDARDIEVIVVPNGPDESWREALLPYRNNPSVRVVRILESNANIARNAGSAEARGEFVRFLDDDDYLFPEGAVRQYELIQASGADLVSGSIQVIDAKGRYIDLLSQPEKNDICTAVLGPSRRCLPTAHVYRKSKISNLRWNPSTAVRQDYEWLFDFCTMTELSWQRIDDIVGVWQQHNGQRVSTSKGYNEIRKLTVPMLMGAYERLLSSGRLNKSRRQAVANGLWDCIHAAFFLEPRYWSQVAIIAQKIDPDAHPIQPIYNYLLFNNIDPLVFQWILLPKRWVHHQIRRFFK